MKEVYKHILEAIKQKHRLLAVLIDPDKMELKALPDFMIKLNQSKATHIFIGGSEVNENATGVLVNSIRKLTKLPLVLFPGDITQITDAADALLFLSLVSGRNPDYLIGKHVKAASLIKNSGLEVIPTGYILIENGKETSVQRVTGTLPMARSKLGDVVSTALASQLLGHKFIYLEAGSGATHPIDSKMISEVKDVLQIPLIVGGGVRTVAQLEKVYRAGADMVVIGTAFENDESFFDELK